MADTITSFRVRLINTLGVVGWPGPPLVEGRLGLKNDKAFRIGL